MTTTPHLQSPGEPPLYRGEFIRVIIGSTIHGLSIPGTDDLDLMGVCVESAVESIGLSKPFEQHVFRTQPEGLPSGVDDIDLTTYSLRKYLRLAANGNPTVLNLLFVQPESRHYDSALGQELRDLIPLIVSREAAARYRGYSISQRQRLMGERGQKHTGYTRRLKYQSGAGWDTKYAMHMIRLGVQGVELLTTGKITLPVPQPWRDLLLEVRLGNAELGDCTAWAISLEDQLLVLQHESELQESPQREELDRWLVNAYTKSWSYDNVRT